MMAAAQPFISRRDQQDRATCPRTATVEDVEQLHLDAWKMGIKAIAIYRDNCKVAQPLSRGEEGQVAGRRSRRHVGRGARADAAQAAQDPPVADDQRSRVGDAKGYITAGEYPGDGLGEIFVKLGKQGSTLSGLLDAFAISVSIGLQYGVPLESYVSKFMNMRFEPAGMTDDPEIRFSTSLVDYLARKIAIEYLPFDKREALGIFTLEERTAMLDEGAGHEEPAVPTAPTAEAVAAGRADAEVRGRRRSRSTTTRRCASSAASR